MEETDRSSEGPKSSSSDSRKHTSGTTSVWDMSAKSSSSNASNLSDLKKRNELLRLQLRQREVELEKEKCTNQEKVGEQLRVKTETEQLKEKIRIITLISDDLQQIIASCEEEQSRRLKELEVLYRHHFEEINEVCSQLRSENGKLQQDTVDANAKISSVIQENNFLRWDSGSKTAELQGLRNRCDEKDRELTRLKVELSSLKSQHQQLAATQKTKALTSVSQNTTTQLAKIRSEFEDREKEYGITLTRIRNEMEYLQKEIQRRENQVNRLTSRLDELTADNKKLLDANVELRKDYDSDAETLKRELANTRMELQAALDENANINAGLNAVHEQCGGSTSDIDMGLRVQLAASQARLETALSTIRSLRAQIHSLHEMARPQSEQKTQKESRRLFLEIAEIREELRSKERALEEERSQRVDAVEMVVEMSRDMRKLIQSIRAA